MDSENYLTDSAEWQFTMLRKARIRSCLVLGRENLQRVNFSSTIIVSLAGPIAGFITLIVFALVAVTGVDSTLPRLA